jgi:hypothetical protein
LKAGDDINLEVDTMARYIALPNYANNLLKHGFDEADLAQPSRRLIDAIVACGDIDAVVQRVSEHRDAGADHVCLRCGRRRAPISRCVNGPSSPRRSTCVPLCEQLFRALAGADDRLGGCQAGDRDAER